MSVRTNTSGPGPVDEPGTVDKNGWSTGKVVRDWRKPLPSSFKRVFGFTKIPRK